MLIFYSEHEREIFFNEDDFLEVCTDFIYDQTHHFLNDEKSSREIKDLKDAGICRLPVGVLIEPNFFSRFPHRSGESKTGFPKSFDSGIL